ncbi:hypothetical protein CDD82_6008 [Ophiocordyceps australis]|uniref:Glycosyl hydrolase family 92 N-terminal domain-containing protein n=1 Tax=Ophiocordyceps australis TaxID=1399860 RepID=A0A2C5ZSV0_9HYPO|nr:hypothetical protein CDD82_6008 [Ophiocordyceps australis]
MRALRSACMLGVLLEAVVADPLAHVRPLIGSLNGGNVFAGATLPYGLAKAVADVDGQNTGGFAMDASNVTGFSSVHDSGTGGNPSLGNFPIFPQLCPGDDLNQCYFDIDDRKVPYKAATVIAEPGMFSLELLNGIQANMTVSQHAALYRFRFPNKVSKSMSAVRPLILLDLTDLWKSRQIASVSVDETTGRIVGNGTFLPSFGAGQYTMHFCVDFDDAKIHETGVWANGRAGSDTKHMVLPRGFNKFFNQGGAFVRFIPHHETVSARMGISYKSVEQACRHAETEIPDIVNGFDALVATAREQWRFKLGPISISPGLLPDMDLIKSFWSGVYRTMISPQNYTGENPHWDTGKPYFDSFYWYVFLSVLFSGVGLLFISS